MVPDTTRQAPTDSNQPSLATTARRVGLAVAVALLVALAGCGGGGVPSPDAPGGGADATPDDGGDAAPGGSGSTPGGSDGTTGESAVWEPLNFDQPATYTYDIFFEGQGEGQMVWEVTETSADGATVSVHVELGDTTYDSTVSGNKNDIRGQLMASPAGQFFLLGLFSPTVGYYEGQELSVGNQWSYSTQEGSASFTITGTQSYAGVECHASEMTVDGSVVHEGCFSGDIGMMPYTAYYDGDGQIRLEMTLVDYSEG